MARQSVFRATRWCLAILIALAAVPPSMALINLELRAIPEGCTARVVVFELYAISDSAADQSLSAMDVILSWDPAVLQLLGNDTSGPYPYNWLFSGFQDDSGLDGLNNTWSDGDALYTAWGQLGGSPAYATPSGLLVTKFRFRKLMVNETTTVDIPASAGMYTDTVVYDGQTPGLDVTGTLSGATITTSPKGDLNCDGVVDLFDIDAFVAAMTALPPDYLSYYAAYPGCDHTRADCNCDGTVNLFDIDPFVDLLTS